MGNALEAHLNGGSELEFYHPEGSLVVMRVSAPRKRELRLETEERCESRPLVAALDTPPS